MIWCLLLLPLVSSLLDSLPPLDVTSSDISREIWLDVRLNHFDASNTDTFPLRFFYNPAYRYSPHIVVFLGGGWGISPEWTQGGLGAELAAGVDAGLVYIEHRYYGLSRPSENTGTSSLRFLTVDQALGDISQVIQHIRSDDFEGGVYKEGKVVLIGCSYAGSLATWMKLAYPHLVDGAFADSAPVVAQEDFPEYLNKLTDIIQSEGGTPCYASIEQSIQGLVALLETSAGPAAISDMFKTCSTISATTPLDVATFFHSIQNKFARLVQASPGDIPSACEVLTSSHSDPVQRLANWVTSQQTDEACLETRYTEVVAAYTNTSYDSPHAHSRLWMYQSCIQFGWFKSTSGADHPFLSTVPLEYYHQMCKDFFGNSFDEAFLRAGIERTNLFFGGSHRPDGVMSSSNSLDPWSPLTSQKHTALSPARTVHGAHCANILPMNSSETDEIRNFKVDVLNYLAMSLQGRPIYMSAATNIMPSLMLLIVIFTLFI